MEAKLEVSILELYYSAKSWLCEYEKGSVCEIVAIEVGASTPFSFLSLASQGMGKRRRVRVADLTCDLRKAHARFFQVTRGSQSDILQI